MKNLEHLNFHHLFYFWVVAEEGSVTAASRRLGLAQPSVSSQVRKLEQSLGGELFERSGRGRVLSSLGRDIFGYADRIFSESQQLIDFLNGKAVERPARLVVGVPDLMPKLIAYRLLKPIFEGPHPAELVCHASQIDDLLSDLAVSRFDLVLSHGPIGSHVKIRAYNHKLGESSLSFFGTPDLEERYGEGFPESLDGAPLLVPVQGTELRRSLDQWFEHRGIRPSIRGEFYDSALMKEFGSSGFGLFAIPTVVREEVCQQYKVRVVGTIDDVRETFYAITTQKRIQHPGVMAIVEAARSQLVASA